MRAINQELSDEIRVLARTNPKLAGLLATSEKETLNLGVYNKCSYDKALENIKGRIKDAMREFDFNLSFEDVKEKLDDNGVIAQEIANELVDLSTYKLIEMMLSDGFDHTVKSEQISSDEDIRINARTYLDESLREELEDEAEEMWSEVVEENE